MQTNARLQINKCCNKKVMVSDSLSMKSHPIMDYGMGGKNNRQRMHKLSAGWENAHKISQEILVSNKT